MSLVKKLIILSCAFSILHTQLYAQFGKLKVLNNSKEITPDYSEQKFNPIIEFQSLLNALKINPQTGLFEPGTMNAYFLPSKDTSGDIIDYSPSTSNPNDLLIRADLIDESGDIVTSFYYEAGNIQPVVTKIIISTASSEDDGFNTSYKFTEAGNFQLIFYLANQIFYKFPFHVSKTISEDPYSASKALYTIGGKWERYGLLRTRYDNSGSEYTIHFQPIIEYKGMHSQSGSSYWQNRAQVQLKCVLKRDGKTIGARHIKSTSNNDIFGDSHVGAFNSYDVYVDKLLPETGDFTFLKIPPPDSGTQQTVQLKNLIDGNYTIELSIEGITERPDFKRTYFFTVNTSKIEAAFQGNRYQNKNNKELLETGRDFILVDSKN